MSLRIAYTKEDGGVAYIIPAPDVSVEQLIPLVPEGATWKVVDSSEIPVSRTYRDAWEGLEHITINLEKAKEVQKKRIIALAQHRVPKDEFGQQDFTQVKAELAAINWEALTTLDEVYNTWVPSIERRSGERQYIFQ